MFPVRKEISVGDPRYLEAFQSDPDHAEAEHTKLAWEMQFGMHPERLRELLLSAFAEQQPDLPEGAQPVFDSGGEPWRVAFTDSARVLMGSADHVYPLEDGTEEEVIRRLQSEGILLNGSIAIRQIPVNLGWLIARGEELVSLSGPHIDSEGNPIMSNNEYVVRDLHLVDVLVCLPAVNDQT